MSANSVADTQLGLTAGELQILRQQQQVMAQRSHQSGNAGRGREQSRHSQPSSRAVSAASSQGPTRIILDPRHLQALQTHMDNLLRGVGSRINELEDATQASINSNSDRHDRTAQNAEDALRRMRGVVAEIGRLEAEFDKITRIKEVVKRLRVRVEETEARLDRHASSDRHTGHHSTHSGHHSSSTPNRVAVDRHRR